MVGASLPQKAAESPARGTQELEVQLSTRPPPLPQTHTGFSPLTTEEVVLFSTQQLGALATHTLCAFFKC